MSISEKGSIRLVLADDHLIVRAGLRAVLADFPHLQIVGEASTAQEAIQEVLRTKPDVVLLDFRMPGGGLTACQQIKQSLPATKILFLTAFEEDEVVFAAVQSTADGFLLKDAPPKELVAAIENVHQNKSVLDPAVTKRVLNRLKTPSEGSAVSKLALLSHQEKRVIALVAQGRTNKEIAQELGLSDKTVKNYLGNAMEKLGISRRSQAAALYVQHLQEKSPGC